MAGEAKTTNFMLGDATLMIGNQADLFTLNPAAHSVGLVKNVALSVDNQYIELTQGVKNTIVDSQITQSTAKVTAEVFEATAKNFRYGLGLSGTGLTVTGVATNLFSSAAAAATTAIVTGDVTSGYANGDWIEISEGEDNVHIAKLSATPSVSTNTTLTFAGYAIPTGVTFTTAAKVRKLAVTNVASVENQPYLSAKIVGKLANGEKVTIMIPKMRIVQGFNLGFTSTDYGNMPFEMTPYAQVSGDVNFSKVPDPTAPLFVLQSNAA
jgi:hypothetical protein